jgi:hypothetical protein
MMSATKSQRVAKQDAGYVSTRRKHAAPPFSQPSLTARATNIPGFDKLHPLRTSLWKDRSPKLIRLTSSRSI